MQFWVELEPAPWKVGNASHFINVERRLAQQVDFLRGLRKENVIEVGPFAIINAAAAKAAFIVNTDSWERLSHLLHEDPMAVYQAPRIGYLADWEEAMAKHASTIGSSHSTKGLEEDVRIDLGLNYKK